MKYFLTFACLVMLACPAWADDDKVCSGNLILFNYRGNTNINANTTAFLDWIKGNCKAGDVLRLFVGAPNVNSRGPMIAGAVCQFDKGMLFESGYLLCIYRGGVRANAIGAYE